jgi:hypothetical protein
MRAARPLRLVVGAAVFSGCLLLGCSLAPVISVPEMESNSYDDCTLAAENYCDLVIGVGEDDREGCVAKYTYQCVSGVSE